MNEVVEVEGVSATRFQEAVQKLGLVGPFPQLTYVRYMERAYGRDGSRFMDAVDAWLQRGAAPEEAGAVHRLLSKRPAMAAYVSRHQYSHLYRSAAELLVQSGVIRQKRVVDYGCGYGLLTRLLALLEPESSFIGVDVPAIAVAATKLMGKEGPANVTFSAPGGGAVMDYPADVVLMVCVTHEMFSELKSRDRSAEADAQFAGLVEGLAVGAQVITVNRLGWPSWQLPKLDRVMASLGCERVDSVLPEALVLEEGNSTSSLPIRVYEVVRERSA